MQKQQYTLFLTRDDGATRSIRFCARTLRLLIALCIGTPVIAIAGMYMALENWQNAAVLSHKNELLREQMQVCQQELQKYATIQQLVTRYEHEASPILVATKAVPAPVPYVVESTDEVDAMADTPEVASTAAPNTEPNTEQNPNAESASTVDAQDVEDAHLTHEASASPIAGHGVNTQETTELVTIENEPVQDEPVQALLGAATVTPSAESNPSAERILQLQTKPHGANQDGFITVTDNKAKLTEIAIREDNGAMQTAFRLSTTTEETIAGHIYVAIQGHDKKLYPIRISEKYTAFRISRFRDYALDFALPKGFNAADVDKVVITAKTRDGEVFYCNGFSLE